MSAPFRADVIQLGPSIELRMGAADPSAGGGVVAPIGSFYYRTSTSEIWQKVTAANTGWVFLTPRDLFGNAIDGDVIIAAGTTTNTRDMYYGYLTIQNGATLNPRGNRLFVRNLLTIDVGGFIDANGGAGGAAGAAGVASPSVNGTVGAAGAAGGASSATVGAPGGAASNCVQGFLGSGGIGGAGASGAGGAAGSVGIQNAASQGNPFSQTLAMVGQVGGVTVARFGGGSGGGAGGGDGTAGGGGGGGGGTLFIFAREVVNNGTIRANGGAGGSPAAGNRGGGAGGGGGLIVLGTHVFSGTAPTVAGGAIGNKSGTGVNGGIGINGLYLPLAL